MLTDTKFARIFRRLTNIPTLPQVVTRLLQLSEEDASPARLAKTIETDPGIAAKVLKLVNSAFYSLKRPVASLSHACGLLGARTIKSLVLSVSAMQVFRRRCDGFDQVRFWRNSLATALVSRKLASRFAGGDSAEVEEAYIAGLLHASGIPLYVQFFPEDYAGVLDRAAAGRGSLIEVEEAEFGAAHPEAGAELAGHWRLPELVGTAIRHHRSAAAELPAGLDDGVRRIVDVVRLADFWTRRAGVAITPGDAFEPDAAAPVPDWMETDEAALAEYLGDIGELAAGLEGFLQAE